MFLKYLYTKKDAVVEIQKRKKNEPINDFNDFSQILNHFYSQRSWSYGEKKELSKLLDVRNAIVHRGQDQTKNQDIAKSIVRTLFFIHATNWSEFGETIFFNNHLPHSIGEVTLWRESAESFADDLVKDLKFSQVYKCLGCGAYAAVNAELMVLDESNHEDWVLLAQLEHPFW